MKRVASALIALALGTSLLTVPAFAAENGIQTYGALCPECNRGEIVIAESYDSPRVIVDHFDCKKNPQKVDLRYQWTHYTTWKCTYCGSGDTMATTQTEDYCPH